MTEICNVPVGISIFLWTIVAMMFVTLLLIIGVTAYYAWEDLRDWIYQREKQKEWDQRRVDSK